MKLSDINPHVRFARIIGRLPRASAGSRNYDCRLFFICDGSGSIVIGEDEYKISNNTAIYIPPASHYRLSAESRDMTLCSVNFDLINDYSHIDSSLGTAAETDFDANRAPSYELPEEFSRAMVVNAPELHKKVVRCCDEFLHGEPYFRENVSALLKLCLIGMIRGSTTYTAESDIVDAAIKHIQNNCTDPALSNDSIAAALGYHPYYLSSLMKQSTGKTLHRYLIDCRLQMAKKYLAATDLDIAVIAWKCGFGSSAYFTKLFRTDVGVTPREYRKGYSMPI